MEMTIAELAPYLRGWRGYFGFCETPDELMYLTRWVRLRLPAAMWRQRKLSLTAAEELLEIIMHYERASTMITSNRPVDDWGKLLGDSAAVTAMLDRLLHHGHVLKCGPRSWRTKIGLPPQPAAG